MKFINKDNNTYKRKGEEWSKEAMKTIKGIPKGDNRIVEWSMFGKKKELKQILLEEQQHLCCYCMRQLQNDNATTIEHIIPRNISSKEDAAGYQTYRFLEPNRVKVLANGDIDTYNSLDYPPFPHLIAYSNLAASCNGQFDDNSAKCCNSKRGDRYIKALFFEENIADITRYDFDGKIDYDERYDDTIKALNLNYSQLCLIRKVWYEIAQKTDYNSNDVEKAKGDIALRNNIIDDIELSEVKYSRLRKDKWWKILADYSWFYEYYSR